MVVFEYNNFKLRIRGYFKLINAFIYEKSKSVQFVEV